MNGITAQTIKVERKQNSHKKVKFDRIQNLYIPNLNLFGSNLAKFLKNLPNFYIPSPKFFDPFY